MRPAYDLNRALFLKRCRYPVDYRKEKFPSEDHLMSSEGNLFRSAIIFSRGMDPGGRSAACSKAEGEDSQAGIIKSVFGQGIIPHLIQCIADLAKV